MKHLDENDASAVHRAAAGSRGAGLEVSAHTQECDSLPHAAPRYGTGIAAADAGDCWKKTNRCLRGWRNFQETRARKSIAMDFGEWLSDWRPRVPTHFIRQYIQPWQVQLEQAGFGGSNLLGLVMYQGLMWKGWQSMITLLEVLGDGDARRTGSNVSSVGGSGVVRRWRWSSRGFCTVLGDAGACFGDRASRRTKTLR